MTIPKYHITSVRQYLIILLATLFAVSVLPTKSPAILPGESSPYDIEIVKRADGTKAELWSKLKRWVALNFDNYKDVTDLEDPEAGTMVIKWNSSVKSPISFFQTSVSGVYLIDVKDGKYRFRVIQPKMYVTFQNPDNVNDLSDEAISNVNADLKFVNGIASSYFNGSSMWPLNDTFNEISASCLDLLSKTPEYKSDRDKEKGRVSGEWLSADRRWRLFHNVTTAYREINDKMSHSLNQFMIQDDDF